MYCVRSRHNILPNVSQPFQIKNGKSLVLTEFVIKCHVWSRKRQSHHTAPYHAAISDRYYCRPDERMARRQNRREIFTYRFTTHYRHCFICDCAVYHKVCGSIYVSQTSRIFSKNSANVSNQCNVSDDRRYLFRIRRPTWIHLEWSVTMQIIHYEHLSNNSLVLPRPAAKRAAALALINCLSNVCQIYTPYLYPGMWKLQMDDSS